MEVCLLNLIDQIELVLTKTNRIGVVFTKTETIEFSIDRETV